MSCGLFVLYIAIYSVLLALACTCISMLYGITQSRSACSQCWLSRLSCKKFTIRRPRGRAAEGCKDLEDGTLES